MIKISSKLTNIYLKALLFLLPIGLYFFYAVYFSENTPFMDDYDAILKFIVDYKSEESYQKRVQLIFSPHNDHRLVFLHLVVLAQYYMVGSINFQILLILGNISILIVLLVLWKAFECEENKTYRFLPVVYLLFSLAYFEASLWAMVSLSGLSVIAFSFMAIYLTAKDKMVYFIASYIFATAAVFTQGNGKIVLACCFIMLMLKRQYTRVFIWLFLSMVLLLSSSAYLEPIPTTYVNAIEILKSPVVYIRHYLSVFSFLGAYFETQTFLPTYSGILSILNTYHGSIIVTLLCGVALTCHFFYLLKVRFHKKNLVLFGLLAFIFLNALAVGYARPSVVFPSRYAIYSTLAIAILYLSLYHIRLANVFKWTPTGFALCIITGALYQFILAPLSLTHYKVTVKNYEKNIILNNYKTHSLNQTKARDTLEIELRSIVDDPLVSLISPSHLKRTINAKVNSKADPHENFEYAVSFPSYLRDAAELGLYNIKK